MVCARTIKIDCDGHHYTMRAPAIIECKCGVTNVWFGDGSPAIEAAGGEVEE